MINKRMPTQKRPNEVGISNHNITFLTLFEIIENGFCLRLCREISMVYCC